MCVLAKKKVIPFSLLSAFVSVISKAICFSLPGVVTWAGAGTGTGTGTGKGDGTGTGAGAGVGFVAEKGTVTSMIEYII